MEKQALQLASVASMIDLFNTDNINVLSSLGYSVDVATNFEEGSITSQDRVNEYKEELKAKGIGTYQVPIPRSIKRIGNIISSYNIVKKLVEEKKYKIVHCHSPIGGVICRLACRRARKQFGTKVIYTAHGFHFFKGASKAAWIIYYPVEKFCSRFTDVLITINQEDYSLAQKFHAKRVEYVPGIGVHTKKFENVVVDKELKRAELGFDKDDFIFMSTGQLSVRKNHEVIIRALAKIDDPKVKYLIVGFGELENDLRNLAKKLNVQSRVVFAGYRSDINELLHIVDAFAFPSLQEGLPVSLMEAMAAGLPVVCSRIRGNVDLVKDEVNGYIVDAKDVNAFKERIEKIVRQNTDDIRENSKKTIKKFDSEEVICQMKDIYKKSIF